MHLLRDPDELRRWRGACGDRVALVPTMGNLHAGHLALAERALAAADVVLVSIFVNPLQFGPGEDFARYPRTLAQDRERLAPLGVHAVFAPAEEALYPRGREDISTVHPAPELSSVLCGRARPGHFTGVCTVLAKLFHLAQPRLALFGEKDFQQLQIVRRMARDLDFPVEILGHPIVREPDGLAMSSRNAYLSAEARRRAPLLYQALQELAMRLAASDGWEGLRAEAWRRLTAAGFELEYLELLDEDELQCAPFPDRPRRCFIAARLDGVRLIDNVPVF